MEYQGFTTAEELHAKQTSDPNLFKAVVYGGAAGVAGAALWYAIVTATQRELGLIAILIGWLVATGVILGSGRKRGTTLQILSVVLTLAAMVGAEYFIVRDLLVAYVLETYGSDAAAKVPLFLPIDVAWDFLSAVIQDDPIELVFWGVAVFTAFRIPGATKFVPATASTPTPSA